MTGWKANGLSQLPVFFQKASLSFLMRFGGLVIQLLGSIIAARLLGVEQFGAFTYAATWAIFLGLLLPVGMGELSIRELPQYLTQKSHGLLSGFLITTVLVVLVTGSFAALMLWLLENHGLLTLSPGWRIVAVFAIIHGLILSTSNALNGFQRILTSQFLETILRQISYLALIAVFVLAGIELTSARVFSLMLYAALPTLAIMVVVLARMHARTGARQKPPEFHAKLWLIGAMPLFMTVLANRLQLDLGVLMVGAMASDAETGIFRVAARGAILVTIANMVAVQLVGPMLSRALAQNKREDAQKLLSQSALVSFATGVPICLVLGFGSLFYLGLFGPDFTEGSLTLQLLLLGQATIVFAGPDAILLVMLRKERLVFLLTLAGVLLNFVLNFFLIRSYGIEGAAIAALVSTAFIRISMVTYIIRATGFDTTLWKPIRRYLAAKSS